MAGKKDDVRDMLALDASITSIAPTSASILTSVAPTLSTEVDRLARELEEVRKGGGALRVARAFVALHRIKEVLDAINGTGGSFPHLFGAYKSEVVPRVFEDDKVGGSLSLAEGFRVTVSTKMQASIKADNCDDAYAWLRANGLGDLITETVNVQTLSSTARTMLEDEGRELPGDIFTINAVNSTSVTKTAPTKPKKA